MIAKGGFMSVITLRGLNSDVEKIARREASNSGTSMNRFIINIIERSLRGKRSFKPKLFNDLDDLIGSITEEDSDHIIKSVSEQRKIDQEIWS
jgi:hypothetical protein